MAKKILLGLLAVFIIIQFFRPTKNIATLEQVKAIDKVYNVTQNVGIILQSACYDCHSNNTQYPWYINIQPIAWWMSDHINEGKKELNFSDFGNYTLKKQDHKLEELIEQIEDKMPLKSYKFAHSEARLTEIQKKTLTDWANGIRSEIQGKM